MYCKLLFIISSSTNNRQWGGKMHFEVDFWHQKSSKMHFKIHKNALVKLKIHFIIPKNAFYNPKKCILEVSNPKKCIKKSTLMH